MTLTGGCDGSFALRFRKQPQQQMALPHQQAGERDYGKVDVSEVGLG